MVWNAKFDYPFFQIYECRIHLLSNHKITEVGSTHYILQEYHLVLCSITRLDTSCLENYRKRQDITCLKTCKDITIFPFYCIQILQNTCYSREVILYSSSSKQMQVQLKTSTLVSFDTFEWYYCTGVKYMHCIKCIQLCEFGLLLLLPPYSFSCTFNLV